MESKYIIEAYLTTIVGNLIAYFTFIFVYSYISGVDFYSFNMWVIAETSILMSLVFAPLSMMLKSGE